MKNKVVIIINGLLLTMLVFGCKKFVEVNAPATSLSSKNIYSSDATAIGALTSLYSMMSSSSLLGTDELTSLSCIAGLSADELENYNLSGNTILNAYYQNSLTNSNNGGVGYWGTIYQKMYLVNAAIEGLSISSGLNPYVKIQLMGEAKFMRAFYYFYLVNLYGDVPLILTTDYTSNSLAIKTAKNLVYQQIVTDLKQAQEMLSDSYLKGDCLTPYATGAEERVRPNKWVATALLARCYLYLGKWADAEIEANKVLSNTSEYGLSSLDEVFIKENREAIWQLQPTQYGFNSQEAYTFLLPTGGPSSTNPVYISHALLSSFEVSDKRKLMWINSVDVDGVVYYYPNKYKAGRSSDSQSPVLEYSVVMRLAEQFLIRAEAKSQQGNLAGAISDLDMIRARAGLLKIKDINPTISQESLITQILKEKQAELFTEWGHRWLDLKRTGKIDEVMSHVTPLKDNGGSWKSYQQNYPITSIELKNNPNLTPTPGY